MVLSPGAAPVASRTRRCDEWREALRHDFVALDVAPDRRRGGSFAGAVDSATLAHLQISRVSSVSQTCRRTRQLADRDDRRFLQVGMLTHGTAVLDQDGRRAVLHPGHLALYETERPFTWAFGRDWELLVFTWPRDAIDLTAGESAGATARRFDTRAGLGSVVAGVLRELACMPPSLSAPGAVRVADEVGGLVGTLAGELAPPATGERAHAELRDRVERYLDEHLADPDLGPASVAAAHFVSTRQLHRLFAGSGESVTRRIRRARLDRARRDLADPRLAGTPVGQVARSNGFTDLAGFSRAFRTAYGTAPSDYRARAGLGSR
ncbi:AraC family transcriptional regulator [Pseudonocardia autotrophica]|uniref:Transcriptional activator NphR n=2 Tax=Pseudonocardia TaxID=1847 RepID=A0A1Y2MTF1_PSEAH|nr:helix-turn-helix domain-containing protein [Pseudonocardia autotrophica]OSY38476.1 Transcriptional activator NphR [Pseudonocardia autotrophica]TDN77081.1 AraC family transcriptional regulator [Pseudonocardia autotrophica]